MLRKRLVLAIVLAVALGAAARAEAPSDRPAGWLGVQLDRAAAEDGTAASGVLIAGIVEGGPAERAGFREGDVVRAVNGIEVATPSDLVATVKGLPPGTWVEIAYERKGDPRTSQIELGARPADTDALEMRAGWIGVRAIDLPASLRRHFGAPAERGVIVSDVTDGSPAESAGLRVGDVVYEVDGKPVRSMGELSARIARAGVGNEVTLAIARDGALMTLDALVAKRPADDGTPAKR